MSTKYIHFTWAAAGTLEDEATDADGWRCAPASAGKTKNIETVPSADVVERDKASNINERRRRVGTGDGSSVLNSTGAIRILVCRTKAVRTVEIGIVQRRAPAKASGPAESVKWEGTMVEAVTGWIRFRGADFIVESYWACTHFRDPLAKEVQAILAEKGWVIGSRMCRRAGRCGRL